MKIKNRHRIKSKEIRYFQNDLQKNFNQDFFDNKTSVETGEYEGVKIVLVDDEPCFMLHDGKIVFTLHGINKYKPRENFVVVDMGAVKFVTNGADVMAPGIVDAYSGIVEGDQVWVCDERNRKPLAVGIAVMSGEQMVEGDEGVAVKLVHYVGDVVWNFSV